MPLFRDGRVVLNPSYRAGLHELFPKRLARTEIDNYRSVMLIKHDVGRVEIVMCQSKRVKMLDCGFNVLEK